MSRKQQWIFWCCVLVVSFVVFNPLRVAEFLLWDDDSNLTQNPLFMPMSASHLLEIWSGPYRSLFIPITYSVWGGLVWILQSFDLEWASHQWVQPFLLLNFSLHLFNAFVLFQILQKLDEKKWVAPLASLIFLFHPLQSEAVLSVSGLKELLWVCFALTAIFFWLKLAKATALLFFLLAILSKPTAIVLIPLFFLIETLVFRKPIKSTLFWLRGAPWIVMSVLGLGLLLLTKSEQSGEALLFEVPLGSRPQIFADTIGFYLVKIFWPWPLLIDHGRTPMTVIMKGFTLEMGVFAFAILAFGLALVFLKGQRAKFVLMVAIFVLPLMPVSGLVNFLQQNFSTVNEKYSYFSLIAGAWFFSQLQGIKWIGKSVVIVLVGLAVVLNFQQMKVWKSNLSVFDYTLRYNPFSFMAENNLGVLAAHQKEWIAASEHFERSLRLNPRNLPAQKNLEYVNQEKELELIRRLFQSAEYGAVLERLNLFLEQDPKHKLARLSKAITLCQVKRCLEALEIAQALQKEEPENSQFQQTVEKIQALILKTKDQGAR